MGNDINNEVSSFATLDQRFWAGGLGQLDAIPPPSPTMHRCRISTMIEANELKIHVTGVLGHIKRSAASSRWIRGIGSDKMMDMGESLQIPSFPPSSPSFALHRCSTRPPERMYRAGYNRVGKHTKGYKEVSTYEVLNQKVTRMGCGIALELAPSLVSQPRAEHWRGQGI